MLRGMTLRGAVWFVGALMAASVACSSEPSATKGSGGLPPTWKSAASPAQGRIQHAATRLADGRVLITGGTAPDLPCTSTAEVYDPKSDKWSATAPMGTHRQLHGAVLLKDGRVLVAGGWDCKRGVNPKTAEVWDPATDKWTETGPMLDDNADPDVNLMPDGRVIVPGRDRLMAWDPTTNQFSVVDEGGKDRFAGATATPLPNGDLVVAGGGGAVEATVQSMTLTLGSDPGGIVAHPLNAPRAFHRTVRVGDGWLLAVGGLNRKANLADARAELFDPTARQWSFSAEVPVEGHNHTVTVLQDGRALVLGRAGPQVPSVPAAWVFSPATTSWSKLEAPSTGYDLRQHTATLLADGRVLVVVAKHALLITP